jgi:PilZ domain
MILSCIQCHQDHHHSNHLSFLGRDSSTYICPDCMVLQIGETNKDKDLNSHDNREAMRIPVFAPVRVSPQSRGIVVTSALIIDASSSGICIETKISLSVEDKIDLKLQGSNSVFHAVGKVMHIQQISSEEIPQYKAGIMLLERFH